MAKHTIETTPEQDSTIARTGHELMDFTQPMGPLTEIIASSFEDHRAIIEAIAPDGFYLWEERGLDWDGWADPAGVSDVLEDVSA